MGPAMLACRPLRLDLTDPMDADTAVNTVIYTGSIEADCAGCGRAVWVGPRQQEVLATSTDVMVACFRCAAQIMAVTGDPDDLRHLGNPEGDR